VKPITWKQPEAYGACLRKAVAVCAELGWSIKNTDSVLGVITLNTGHSWRANTGMDVTITVVEHGDGSKVTLNVQATPRNALGGRRPLLFGGKGAVADHFYTAMTGRQPVRDSEGRKIYLHAQAPNNWAAPNAADRA
jgi:hypothetical protein